MVPVFLVYGLGQGLAQPTLINTDVWDQRRRR
jgi:hypothetical protein